MLSLSPERRWYILKKKDIRALQKTQTYNEQYCRQNVLQQCGSQPRLLIRSTWQHRRHHPHGSPVQPRLKGTQGFGVMLLQGFKSVVLHLGCILESAEFFFKTSMFGTYPLQWSWLNKSGMGLSPDSWKLFENSARVEDHWSKSLYFSDSLTLKHMKVEKNSGNLSSDLFSDLKIQRTALLCLP